MERQIDELAEELGLTYIGRCNDGPNYRKTFFNLNEEEKSYFDLVFERLKRSLPGIKSQEYPPYLSPFLSQFGKKRFDEISYFIVFRTSVPLCKKKNNEKGIILDHLTQFEGISKDFLEFEGVYGYLLKQNLEFEITGKSDGKKVFVSDPDHKYFLDKSTMQGDKEKVETFSFLRETCHNLASSDLGRKLRDFLRPYFER